MQNGGDKLEIVERIFSLIQEKGIEQKSFAAQVGVSPQKVSEWKNGKAKSYTKYLPQIAEALGTTVQWLATGEGSKTKQPATGEGDGPSENEILFRKLPPDLQEEALRYMRYLAAQSEKSEGSEG